MSQSSCEMSAGGNDNEEEEGVDLLDVANKLFLDSKKGRNVVDVLCEIKRHFETQNKILLKISQQLNSNSKKSQESVSN
jgi:hypothetical protein